MDKVQPYVTDLHRWLNDALDFAHQGFLQVNVVLGLLIAVVAAAMLGRYRLQTVIVTTIAATIIYILAQVLVPVIDHHAQFRLPDMMVEQFWRNFGLLAVGLFIIITAFYVVKRTVMRGGGGAH